MPFGLGKEKKKKEILEFDLEKDLKNPASLRAMKEKVNTRILELKSSLRQGEDKRAFEEKQALLQGYLAAQKIIGRIGR